MLQCISDIIWSRKKPTWPEPPVRVNLVVKGLQGGNYIRAGFPLPCCMTVHEMLAFFALYLFPNTACQVQQIKLDTTPTLQRNDKTPILTLFNKQDYTTLIITETKDMCLFPVGTNFRSRVALWIGCYEKIQQTRGMRQLLTALDEGYFPIYPPNEQFLLMKHQGT